MLTLIKKNTVSLAIHICICVVLSLPVNIMWWGGVWYDRQLEFIGLAANGLIITGYMIGVLFLYSFAVKKFLYSSSNLLTDVFSVIALFIIIAVTTLVAYDGTAERFFRIPFYPLGGTISHFFQIEEKYTYLTMSILPSLLMWIGMTKNVRQSASKNIEHHSRYR